MYRISNEHFLKFVVFLYMNQMLLQTWTDRFLKLKFSPNNGSKQGNYLTVYFMEQVGIS